MKKLSIPAELSKIKVIVITINLQALGGKVQDKKDDYFCFLILVPPPFPCICFLSFRL